MKTTFKKQLSLKISQKPRAVIWYSDAAKIDNKQRDIRPTLKR